VRTQYGEPCTAGTWNQGRFAQSTVGGGA
jgi:hypothetical protein